jgi:hypothetical protein
MPFAVSLSNRIQVCLDQIFLGESPDELALQVARAVEALSRPAL